jgi:hypothetical protein
MCGEKRLGGGAIREYLDESNVDASAIFGDSMELAVNEALIYSHKPHKRVTELVGVLLHAAE